MREILFKGKRIDNGEWVYGQYYCDTKVDLHAIVNPTIKEKPYILLDNTKEVDMLLDLVQVNPETVSQYTGLTDKNGAKIFEGDIILEKNTGYKAVVEWQHDSCRFLAIINRNSENSPNFFYVDKGSDRGCQMSRNEIIGNIHDKEVN